MRRNAQGAQRGREALSSHARAETALMSSTRSRATPGWLPLSTRDLPGGALGQLCPQTQLLRSNPVARGLQLQVPKHMQSGDHPRRIALAVQKTDVLRRASKSRNSVRGRHARDDRKLVVRQ